MKKDNTKPNVRTGAITNSSVKIKTYPFNITGEASMGAEAINSKSKSTIKIRIVLCRATKKVSKKERLESLKTTLQIGKNNIIAEKKTPIKSILLGESKTPILYLVFVFINANIVDINKQIIETIKKADQFITLPHLLIIINYIIVRLKFQYIEAWVYYYESIKFINLTFYFRFV